MNKSWKFIVFQFLLCFTLGEGQIHGDMGQTPRVALVLSGGGARGFAHVGVLQIIDSLGIPIQMITGTSMGAIVGELYALGYSANDLDSLSNQIDWTTIFSDKPPREKLTYFEKYDQGRFQLSLQTRSYKIQEPSGLIYGQKVSLLLQRLITPQFFKLEFDNLPIPFYCVAADLLTGEEVVLKEGSLAKAIRASMSVPSIFTPVEWENSLLVDGGVLNNLPTDIALKMGATHVIAVNVGQPLRSQENLSGAISILYQSLALASNVKEKENLQKADLLITPDLQGFSTVDFTRNRIKMMIERGRQAARQNLDELIQFKQTMQISPPSRREQPRFEKGIIYGIQIHGYQKLSFSFIYQFLGLKPGDIFNLFLIENRLESLYGLGYFQIIEYQLEPVGNNLYRLHLFVKENPGAFLRFGFHYQDNYKVVLGANVKLKDFPLPGMLSDMTYLFSGLQLWEWELGYPRRMFGTRLYPYAYAYYQDIPVDIYFERKSIAEYKRRSYGGSVGLGFIVKNWGEIKTDYLAEKLLINPQIAFSEQFTWPEWKYAVHLIRVYATVDLLNEPLTPEHGYFAKLGYESTINFIDQRDRYRRFYLEQSFYGTFLKRNTSGVYIFWGLTQDAELYRYFYLGGSKTFVGYNYDEFSGPNMLICRFENYFHLNRFFSVLGIINVGNIWEDYKKINLSTNKKIGYGVGFLFNTFAGPFHYIFGFSEKKTVHYFTFGFSLATRNDYRK